MSKTLIIYFNDQSLVKTDEKARFLATISQLAKVNSIAVGNIDEFATLMNYLPDDQEVYVFIHIMSNYLFQNINADYPGKTWAISLQNMFEKCEYVFVTSDTSKKAVEIFDGKMAYNINDLMHEIFVSKTHKTKPQTIGDITGYARALPINNKPSLADFVIINALHDDEFEAVKEVFKMKKDERNLNGKSLYRGVIEKFPDKKIYGIYQTNSGMTDATALAVDVINELNPRYIFMTGVCGGDEKRNFGDIMIAKFVFTITNKGKISDDGFLRELELVKTDELTMRKIMEENNNLTRLVKTDLIGNKDYDKFNNFNFQKIMSYIEPMACSNSVVDKPDYFTEVIKQIDRKAASVEMESYGIARACETTNYGQTKFMIIKGVMDNTVNKDDSAKAYASITSALYLNKILEEGIIT